MTGMTFLIIGLYMFFFIRNKNINKIFFNVLILQIVLDILQTSALFLNINNVKISIVYLNSNILLLLSIYYIYKNNILINKKLFFYISIFIGLIIFNLIIENIFPYQNKIITINGGWDLYILGEVDKAALNINYVETGILLLKILMYIFITCILKISLSKEKILELSLISLRYAKFIIYYMAFEFITKNFLNYIDLISLFRMILLGNEGQISTNGDFYRLIGLSIEPSGAAISLYLIFLLDMIIRHSKYSFYNLRFLYEKAVLSKIEKILLLILLVLTGAFSSIWYILMLLCVYIIIIEKQKKLVKNFLLGISIIMVSFFIMYNINQFFYYFIDRYIERLDNLLYGVQLIFSLDNIDTIALKYGSSNMARFLSLYEGIKDFFARPILGLGLGLEITHSSLVNNLLDYGLIGFYLLIKIILYKVNDNVYYNKKLIFFLIFIAQLPVGGRAIGFSIIYIFIIELTQLFYKKEKIYND